MRRRSAKSGSNAAADSYDWPTEHRTCRWRPGRVYRSIAESYRDSTKNFHARNSFILSCAPERHRNGFESLEREKHLDRHPEIARDPEGQFQARFVIATFEITDRLIVDPYRFGQLPPGYATFRTKD